jgi:CxxC motif-containing protein (DUF1111 family)
MPSALIKGEAAESSRSFAALTPEDQRCLLAFLNSL